MSGEAQHLGTAPIPNVTTRLANVIYWAGCVLALIWLAVCVNNITMLPAIAYLGPVLTLTVGGTVVIWLIGRAVRYVMIGR